MDVSIKISARHVHLTKEAIELLFGHDLTVRNMLNQVGQFATEETVSIVTDKGRFDNVRIIGPARGYNQVEVSKTDARKLGINPMPAKSGNLQEAEYITILTEKGSISGNFAIIADRHVHFSLEDAEKFGVQDDEVLKLEIGGKKKGVIDVFAKVSKDGFFEAHLDTDDANAFLINSGDICKLTKTK